MVLEGADVAGTTEKCREQETLFPVPLVPLMLLASPETSSSQLAPSPMSLVPPKSATPPEISNELYAPPLMASAPPETLNNLDAPPTRKSQQPAAPNDICKRAMRNPGVTCKNDIRTTLHLRWRTLREKVHSLQVTIFFFFSMALSHVKIVSRGSVQDVSKD